MLVYALGNPLQHEVCLNLTEVLQEGHADNPRDTSWRSQVICLRLHREQTVGVHV